MAALKINLGRIPCPECGDLTALKENEAGTLSLSCQECDFSGFAKKGTAAANRWRGKLPKAPAPAPTDTAPKAPASKPPKAGFSMENL